jgi:hypothetical protein
MTAPQNNNPGPERRETKTAKERPKDRSGSSRKLPLLPFIGFYVLIIGIAATLSYFFPLVRDAWVSSSEAPTGAVIDLSKDAVPAGVSTGNLWERSSTAFLITVGALTMALPVAWIYMYTRRLRFDPSLVQSVIILPMVIAGIVIIVKNSIALAFSLAGIVAAVRFRNTLKDPKDAVYIFLAIGIGIAAGVHALDVALVMSVLFNTVVLLLWRFNLATIYGGELQRDLLSIGDRTLLLAETTRARDALKWRLGSENGSKDADGILLVHTDDAEGARRAVELLLTETATEWHIIDNLRRRRGITTFAVLLQLDKKGDPLELLSELDDRWSASVSAAEYIPLRRHLSDKEG